MNNLELVYQYTKDGLRLMGGYYHALLKDICVVFIHGMGENIINDYFANIWANCCSENNISFLFGHTRGHSYINFIKTKDDELKKCGTTYEDFEESVYDVDLWVNFAKEKGYKKIVLMGHSLGCNKVIHYLSEKGNVVDGVILASPADIVGLIKNKKYIPNYEELIAETEINVLNNKKEELLSEYLWGEHPICSKTFLDYTKEDSSVDNLPMLRNPAHFKEIEQIQVPILAIIGDKDDSIIRSVEEDLNLIKKKASNCPNFEICIVQNANHYYEKVEQEVGEYIKNWVLKNFYD